MIRLIAGALILLAAPSYAKPVKPNGWATLGAGTDTCGKWTEHQPKLDIEAIAELGWLSGFLTGYNAFDHNPSGNITAGIDGDGVSAWLTGYCTTHPLDRLSVAAIELVAVLRARQTP